ncbi:hypothetical protein TWF281_004570 [Arthrobotrys megalospora]
MPLRFRSAGHPESDTRVVSLLANLRKFASCLTELRLYTFIVDGPGLADLVGCVPHLKTLHLENHWYSWSYPGGLTLLDMSMTLSSLHTLTHLHVWNESDLKREYNITDEHIHSSFGQNCKSLQELVLGVGENAVICKIVRDGFSWDLDPGMTQLRAKDEPDKRVVLLPPNGSRTYVKSYLT